MSNITQLNPPLPVMITSPDKSGMKGLAHFLCDMGCEHDTLWGVALDQNGEFWWIPNPEIRMQPNWSMNRMRPKDPRNMSVSEFARTYKAPNRENIKDGGE